MPERTPEEIRASIEKNRQQLGVAVERLRTEVTVATDWRKQVREHQEELTIGAAAVGFVISGGLAAVLGIFGRRRR